MTTPDCPKRRSRHPAIAGLDRSRHTAIVRIVRSKESQSPVLKDQPAGGRRAGLQDIARELGVSVSLVSKVLNNRLGTSGASREMVNAITSKAAELQYRKNAAAHSLAGGKQNAIGVFIHQHGVDGSNISEAIVRGIAEAAIRHSQRLVLQYYQSAPQLSDLLPLAHGGTVDGLILAGVPHAKLATALQEALREQLPVVTIYAEPVHADFPNIGIRPDDLLRAAVDHLVERGCRKIVHVSRDVLRESGFVSAIRARGLSLDANAICKVPDFSIASGVRAARFWLQERTPFDGIVCQSDQHACGVMNELSKAGVGVPGQAKVVGIDNSPYCDLLPVPLSSVSQQDIERARLAVDLLMKRVGGEHADSVFVAPVLHPRESSR